MSPPVEHPDQVGDDFPPHLFRVEGAPLPSVRAESAPHGEGLPLPEGPAGRECNPGVTLVHARRQRCTVLCIPTRELHPPLPVTATRR